MSAALIPEPDVTRRPLTVADLSRMIDAGIIDGDEKVELLEGELIEVAAKTFAHEMIKSALLRIIGPAIPDTVFLGVEASLRLTPDTLVEPDLFLCQRALVVRSPEGFVGLAGRDLLLVVEVADTTLRKDRGRKAALYAAAGVPEYWIVDTNERVLWRHRGPEGRTYATVERVGGSETITPAAPELAAIAVTVDRLG